MSEVVVLGLFGLFAFFTFFALLIGFGAYYRFTHQQISYGMPPVMPHGMPPVMPHVISPVMPSMMSPVMPYGPRINPLSVISTDTNGCNNKNVKRQIKNVKKELDDFKKELKEKEAKEKEVKEKEAKDAEIIKLRQEVTKLKETQGCNSVNKNKNE